MVSDPKGRVSGAYCGVSITLLSLSTNSYYLKTIQRQKTFLMEEGSWKRGKVSNLEAIYTHILYHNKQATIMRIPIDDYFLCVMQILIKL